MTVLIPCDIAADLELLYGPSWPTREDIRWSVFGTKLSLDPTVFVTRRRTSSLISSKPWPSLNRIELSATTTSVASVIYGVRGYQSSIAAINSPVATIQDAGDPQLSNYLTQTEVRAKQGDESNAPTAGSNQFGSMSCWDSKSGDIEGDFSAGTAGTSLDLYEIAGSGVSRLATFTLSNSGSLQFTVISEIPESLDTDGDGSVDLAEIKAGTDRHDPADFLRLESIVLTSSGPQILANTKSGEAYHLEYSETLEAGSWHPIAAHFSREAATPFDFADEDTVRRARPKGFYRVRVVP